MLTIRSLKKSVGGRVLFEDAAMQIAAGARVALVGPNGAGKSTLFSLILKADSPDSGEIALDEWASLGYLPQEAEARGPETALEIATGRAGLLEKLEAELREMERAGLENEAEYYNKISEVEKIHDPQIEAAAKKMLKGLGFAEADFHKAARELSGGWVMRAHLARLLAFAPELLLLDEPTNHLDLVSLLWLQNHLRNYSGALLLISHDRAFMDAVVDEVYEIAERKLIPYTGNYSEYLREREARYERQLAAHKNQQKEIAALQEFADRFRNVASKASQAQSKLKQIERMEKIEKPAPPRKPFRFRIPDPPRVGQRAIALEDVHFAYGANVVYRKLDVSIERGERVVLVGPNGAGKSTLLKLLAGELSPQQGRRIEGHNARVGYFSQHRSATLDPNRSVLEEVLESARGTGVELREDEARGILGSFLFRKEEVFKKTPVLSGGEKTRLNLIKFLVNPPNVLLMDEPTTHLDILTVESLTLALESFSGTLVFISHDVHFIRNLANRVLHVSRGNVASYPGGYDYFLEKSGGLLDERAAVVAA